MAQIRNKKVWIDLDNSPHVPFFAPILQELEKRGYETLVTARDCFQVCDLADLHRIPYQRIGRHYGKSKILKVAGSVLRGLQLAPTVLRERPDVAVSHGSRAQLLTSALLRVRSIVICDYEFVKGLKTLRPDLMLFPEVIAAGSTDPRIKTYPGIKEDVYVPKFVPDLRLRAELGVGADELMVTLRPPADEAHYHNPESEALLEAVVALLAGCPEAKVILLPRGKRQEARLRDGYADLFASGKMRIPDHAVDGLNLIWNSDLVISGGGTMNREAAALGVPVYSIFRGKIGAVDRFLALEGRLTLLESIEDVHRRIALRRRSQEAEPGKGDNRALETIVDRIESLAGGKQPAKTPAKTREVEIRRLNEQAVQGLAPMFDPERQLFCYKLRQGENGLVREGLSHRYTMMTLLGLHRAEAAGLQSPVDVKRVLGGMLQDTTWIDNIGDLGLLLWTCAMVSPERLEETCSRAKLQDAFSASREVREGRTMEMAWFLSGIAHAELALPGRIPGLAHLGTRAYELLRKNQGPSGAFGHLAKGNTISGYIRGRIGSFADQVYPIYSFSAFARAFGMRSALESAKKCADMICRAQGRQGQWWWHYDAASGGVAEQYPVYSVHQEAMAPMALLELQATANLDYNEAIQRGLRWIAGENELACDMRHSSGLVWRCVSPRSPVKVYQERFRHLFSSETRPLAHEDLAILFECRPYELGWLLYAFA